MFNRPWEPLVAQELQQQMTQTPTPGASPDDTGLLGLIATLGSLDLGYLETFTFQRGLTKQTLESRRAAVRQIIKNKTTKVEVSGSFSTYSIKKQAIIDVWNGSAAGITGEVTTGALTFRMAGETGEPGLRLVLAAAEVEGNDIQGTFSEDYMQLGFNYTAVLDATNPVIAKLELLAAAA